MRYKDIQKCSNEELKDLSEGRRVAKPTPRLDELERKVDVLAETLSGLIATLQRKAESAIEAAEEHKGNLDMDQVALDQLPYKPDTFGDWP